MGSKNELLKKIEDGYPKFSKGQKKLADFIRLDYDKAAFLTAEKRLESASLQWYVLPWPLVMTDIRNFSGRLAR